MIIAQCRALTGISQLEMSSVKPLGFRLIVAGLQLLVSPILMKRSFFLGYLIPRGPSCSLLAKKA